MPIPEELDHLVTRTVTAKPKPHMPTRVLRWENAFDLASGLGPARQEEIHAAVSALRSDGGLLFLVLPLGEVYEGGNFAAVRKMVGALAGKANLGDVELEVLEGSCSPSSSRPPRSWHRSRPSWVRPRVWPATWPPPPSNAPLAPTTGRSMTTASL